MLTPPLGRYVVHVATDRVEHRGHCGPSPKSQYVHSKMFLTVALLKTKTRLIPLTLYVHEFDADTLKTSYIKKSIIAKIDMNECQTDEASYHQSGKYGDTKYKISRQHPSILDS